MYFYGYRQHQPHAFVNKLNYIKHCSCNIALLMYNDRLQELEIIAHTSLSDIRESDTDTDTDTDTNIDTCPVTDIC